MRSQDWIRLLEASYELDQSDDEWRAAMLEHATPMFEECDHVVLFIVGLTPSRVELEHLEVPGGDENRERAIAINRALPPGARDLVYRSGPAVATLSELVVPQYPEAGEAFESLAEGLARDLVAAIGRADAGRMALLVGALDEVSTTTATQRHQFHLAMSHLGAGLRIRTALARGGVHPDEGEAVFDASGRMLHADGPAKEQSAREALRQAVAEIDRARSARGRSEGVDAVERWQGLVDGRWSLVDHFDRDGKRFVVAHKNDPSVRDPRGLSVREKQIAELVGMGRSTKEIAYELGLSNSAIGMAVKAVCSKLGLSSRTELAHLFAPRGLRARLEEVLIEGEDMLVGSVPLLDEEMIAPLSATEREVLVALLAGSTTADIAQRRGVRPNTIANQTASIFQKLGVRSRAELASRAGSRPS